MKKSMFLILFLLLCIVPSSFLLSQSNKLSEQKKSVLLVEIKHDSSFIPVATAFAVYIKGIPFIVTNKHVANQQNLYFRIVDSNDKRKIIRQSIDSLINLTKLPWDSAESADIAVIPFRNISVIDSFTLKSIGISFFKKWEDMNEADEIFVLGFPMGIGAIEFHPVFRYGIIALKTQKGQFYIDSKIYPGNSGSPVFIKPSYFSDDSVLSINKQGGELIGIVSAYVPYEETAVSLSTGRPRITFEENSGLAVVYSADLIADLIFRYIEKYSLAK